MKDAKNNKEKASIGGLQSETGEFRKERNKNISANKGQATGMCAIKMGNYTFLKNRQGPKNKINIP